jgi:hypothetical protein
LLLLLSWGASQGAQSADDPTPPAARKPVQSPNPAPPSTTAPAPAPTPTPTPTPTRPPGTPPAAKIVPADDALLEFLGEADPGSEQPDKDWLEFLSNTDIAKVASGNRSGAKP